MCAALQAQGENHMGRKRKFQRKFFVVGSQKSKLTLLELVFKRPGAINPPLKGLKVYDLEK